MCRVTYDAADGAPTSDLGFPCPFEDALPPPLAGACASNPTLGSGKDLRASIHESERSSDSAATAPMPVFVRRAAASSSAASPMAYSAATTAAHASTAASDCNMNSLQTSGSTECFPTGPFPVGEAPDSKAHGGASLVDIFKQTMQRNRERAANTKDPGRCYTKLFVGQVPPWPNAKEWLEALFAPYGVKDIVLRSTSDRVNAFVWCRSRESAEAATASLNGHKYQNKRVWYTLCVEPSRPF